MCESKIIEIFQDILDIKKEKINLKSTSADIDRWDSIATINLIIAIEEEFGIKFKLEDFQTVRTIEDFAKLVKVYKE